ncbi:unnamed protein product [Microthlaspi erraticum]|uniref:F-box domain-containing protein n=1 Tax=Microthlaspi erraticum TaxID=1685480 RepID=A0A6D2HM37_9BRAS|nr:unnamed protein product [Microthlaspi erraticum]
MMEISNLPGDLLEEIFSRVPLESMKEVRLTCKTWNTLTKGRYFPKKLLAQAKAAREFMAVMVLDSKVCLMSINLHKEEDVESSIKCKGKLMKRIDVSHTYHCGGLLLCIPRGSNPPVVLNPYLGKTRWIFTINFRTSYAIGYETRNSYRSYKILSFVSNYGLYGKLVKHEIYDLDSWRPWRALDVSSEWEPDFCRGGVSVKGNTYWYAHPKGEMGESLICFDFTREIFIPNLPLPCHSNDHGRYIVRLSSVGEEKLAVLFQRTDISRMEIWITDKTEPNDVSWRMLFVSVNTAPLNRVQSELRDGGFLVDEEEKAAVFFYRDTSRNKACIIGEDEYLREVDRWESTEKYFDLGSLMFQV